MAREEGEGIQRLKETSGLAHVVFPADCRRRLQGHTQRAVRRRPGCRNEGLAELIPGTCKIGLDRRTGWVSQSLPLVRAVIVPSLVPEWPAATRRPQLQFRYLTSLIG